MTARLFPPFVTLLAAAAVVLAVGTGTARADERRIATLAPSGSAWMNILEQGARRLEASTAGRVDIKWYPGGTQGDERDVVRKIKLGQLDGAALTTVGLGMIYPGIRVLQLPFLFESVDEVDHVRNKMWPYFQKKFAARGFRLQYAGDVGWIYLYSNTPLTKMSDLEKVKFFVWTDDPIARALFGRLEISAVPLGVPEVLAALETGRINGCYTSPLGAVALQWYTRVTHVAEKPLGYAVGGMVVRQELWDALSAADQKIENKLGKKIGKKLIARARKDNDRARNAMRRAGIELVPTPAAFERALKAEAEKVWRDLAGDVYSDAELDMVLTYRDEYRAMRDRR